MAKKIQLVVNNCFECPFYQRGPDSHSMFPDEDTHKCIKKGNYKDGISVDYSHNYRNIPWPKTIPDWCLLENS